jgi:hypothetical protein
MSLTVMVAAAAIAELAGVVSALSALGSFFMIHTESSTTVAVILGGSALFGGFIIALTPLLILLGRRGVIAVMGAVAACEFVGVVSGVFAFASLFMFGPIPAVALGLAILVGGFALLVHFIGPVSGPDEGAS